MFRLLLLLLVLLLMHGIDAGFGWIMRTRERHTMNLRPDVAVRHRSAEFDYTYKTNSLGFREPEIDIAKPAGTTRIAVVGDSFVAGLGVENDQIFTAKLAGILNEKATGQRRFEILNRGRPGSSTIREFDLYRHHTQRFQPDVVVLAFGMGNDLVEILVERTEAESAGWTPNGWMRRTAYALLPNTYLELAMMKRVRRQSRQTTERTEAELIEQIRAYAGSRGVDADTAEQRFRKMPEKYRELARQGLVGNDYTIFYACVEPQRFRNALHPDDEFFDKAWPRMETQLDRFRDQVQADGAQFVVMTIPDANTIDRKSLTVHRALGYKVSDAWLTTTGRTRTALADWCRRKSVPFLDLTAPFRVAAEPLYYPLDGHFNPAGHAQAAKLLGEFLLSREIVELQP